MGGGEPERVCVSGVPRSTPSRRVASTDPPSGQGEPDAQDSGVRTRSRCARQPLSARRGSPGKDLAPHTPEGLACRAHARHPRTVLRTCAASGHGIPCPATTPQLAPMEVARRAGCRVVTGVTGSRRYLASSAVVPNPVILR